MEYQSANRYIPERGNCSTVIVGKNASVTGKVILGHNEDDTEAVVQSHYVPRIKHKPGEVISFADGGAVIPQVEETYAYYWSEVRCRGGISFADGFVNEWGVAVVSNACRPSKDALGAPSDNRDAGGMGYALRRLVAERAKSAREGVLVAAALIEEFGYFSSRSYQIVDKDEAWVVQVPKGHNYVAQRVGDDEIYYIPNWYTIHHVDFEDARHKNFYFSKNLVSHAIENGWYKPAKEGDYSDFDFAAVYQDGDMQDYNVYRARNAWRILTGETLPLDKLKPFSVKVNKKYSADDVKKVLRSHYEGTEDDHSNDFEKNPHRGYYAPFTLCNPMTVESMVVEFNEDINLTRMYRSSPKPCVSPYTPWYPVALTKVPAGYSWMPAAASQAAHFYVDDSELRYRPDMAWWAFKTLQYFTEFNYKDTHEKLHREIARLEERWEKEKSAVESAYNLLAKTDLCAAKEYLQDYTFRQAQKAWDWANMMISKLGEERVYENCARWGEFDK